MGVKHELALLTFQYQESEDANWEDLWALHCEKMYLLHWERFSSISDDGAIRITSANTDEPEENAESSGSEPDEMPIEKKYKH